MTGLLHRYEALVASGELRIDAEQAAAAERLELLQRELESAQARGGLLGKLFGKKRGLRAGSTCGAASGAASRC
jgi:cell division protein ZapE